MDYDSDGLAHDLSLEQAVLGTVLFKPEFYKTIQGNVKLTRDSFYFDKNRNVFQVISDLSDQGVEPTDLLVSSHLNGTVPKGYVSELVGHYTAQDIVDQSQRLVELQRWRERRTSALNMLAATKDRDLEQYTKAKNEIDGDEIKAGSMQEPKQLASKFKTYLDSGEVEAFPLPYPKLNARMAGGLRRKQMSIIGGWSSHGKSVVIDQWLEYFAISGFKCHLYINEMGEEDRVARSIARHSHIPFNRLIQQEVSDKERKRVDALLEDGCPYFSITECAGWSVQELAYDIRSREFDVIGVDMLHGFDYDSEGELARISRILARTTKQANCHIISTVHLNEYRVNDIVRPRPVTRDIRGSGMLKNDSDNTFFIHREQDPSTGDPLPPALIYSSKVRNGQMGYVPLMFNEGTFSFEEAE